MLVKEKKLYSTYKLDSGHVLQWRSTPWDSEVFNRKTIEIMDIRLDGENGRDLIGRFEEETKPDLIYGRFEASNQKVKKLMIDSGFYICETALRIYLPRLDNYKLDPIFDRRKLSLRKPKAGDHQHMLKYTGNMFDFSRFHEDPYIDRFQANQRMVHWVQDMLNRNTPVLVYSINDKEPLAYIFYQEEDEKIELLLGGCIRGKGMYAPFFFGSLISHFQKKGFKKIHTTVSAANNGILSLYLSLGFRVSKTLSDYHKQTY